MASREQRHYEEEHSEKLEDCENYEVALLNGVKGAGQSLKEVSNRIIKVLKMFSESKFRFPSY
jgi:hypothetical protein